MKKFLLLSFLLFAFQSGFSQFGNVLSVDSTNTGDVVALDTTDYPLVRDHIRDQSFFIQLDSSNINAYIKRSMLEIQMNDFAAAVKDYNKIIEGMPNSTEAYSNRGSCYCMLKNYKAALSDMNKALQLSPDPMSYKMRAFVKVYCKNYRGAIADLDTAIKMNPAFTGAYCNKGGTEMRMANYKAALKDYSKALELDPQYWEAYTGRMEADFKLQDYDGVIADAAKVLVIKPDYNEYHFLDQLAQSYEKKGDAVNAKIYADKAAAYKKGGVAR